MADQSTPTSSTAPPATLTHSFIEHILTSYRPQNFPHYEQIYKEVHSNPELSCHESRTAARVSDHLEKLGYETHRNIGGHGVAGVLRNGEGATILLRADMDAVPVQEETGLPYASQVRVKADKGEGRPVMHACGHDIHIVSLMAAAEILEGAKREWKGVLICLFQPNEELGGGAKAMVEDGLYEKIPKPDVLFGQHVIPLKSGVVALRPGATLAESTTLEIRIHGRGGHGSAPQTCVDPIAIAAYILVRLQSIVSRSVNPEDIAVVTCGSIHGGDAANVIPDEAVLGINIRTYDHGTHEDVLRRIKSIVTHECEIAACPRSPSITTTGHFPLTKNDEKLAATLRGNFAEHFKDNVHLLNHNTASEDFSGLADAVGAPYVYWALGGTDPETWEASRKADELPQLPGNHSSKFAPAIQPTLDTGANALTIAALTFLAKPQ